MKIVSYMLASIVLLFIVVMMIELGTNRGEIADLSDVTTFKPSLSVITSINIMIFAFSVQFMVLPAYSELENRSTERFSKVSIVSSTLYTIAFLSLGLVGVLMFGSDIDSDFLINLSHRHNPVSVICRASYILVLMFHIPYFFFAVKEYMLVIYDEIESRSLSTKLELKLAHFLKDSATDDE